MRNTFNPENELEDDKPDPDHIKDIIIDTMQRILHHVREMDSTGVFHLLKEKESQQVSLQILSLVHYIYMRLLEMAKPEEDDQDDEENATNNT